jgi:hypothetical protein
MMSATAPDQLSELIRTSFPTEPLPQAFWINGTEQPPDDIPDELAKRLAFRSWVDVTMHDWTTIGAPASAAKTYLHPGAFRYYLPSLLVDVLQDIGYLDWALECLLPAGCKRRTDRAEWTDFWDGFSETQRDAIRSYLKGVRSMIGASITLADQQLFDELEAIWGRL